MGDVLQKIMPQNARPVKTGDVSALYSHIFGQCHPVTVAMTV